MSSVSVAIVDDHRVVAHSLKIYLESFVEFEVVGLASSGEELLSRLHEWRPDIVLMDLLLPGGLDGIETTRLILERMPGTRIVALTACGEEARLIGALRAGAAGYVRKGSNPEVLLAAMRAVARGELFIDSTALKRILLTTHPIEALTGREIEVLRQMVLGRSNKEIALALAIGDETVKTHVGNILSKLQANNRTQAIILALKRGLVSLEDLES